MGRVSLRGVRKSFGTVDVIKGVDLEVDDGEFLVFVGPSGCGKSTMLRMIAGLESIDAGDLLIDGQRANDVRPSDRGAAMVFQNYALYPHMTVAENMGFALKMAGISRTERDEQVQRAADVLRIGDLLGRMPKELSGGQRQRVAIGRAIVRKPRVFLFDEPLSNLDAALRVNMRIELSRLHRELGTTMIYVTHDQVEAMTMGTRIAVFNQGRIEQLGAPLSLYNAPANEFVAGFLGAPRINLVDQPGVDATPVQRALWSLMLPSADAQVRRAGVRAEHVRVAALGAGVPATVVMAEHLGDVSVLHLRVDGVAELLHAKVDASHAHLGAGASVGIVPDTAYVMTFDASGRRIG
ncbi:MAG: sn-glycerol-3-phosphate ABC transporter ATP-binding protein UgpC [Burkholderiaceae bacterium]